jgi:hypothetical protein
MQVSSHIISPEEGRALRMLIKSSLADGYDSPSAKQSEWGRAGMEQTEIQAFRVIVPKLPYQSLHSSIQ